MEGVAQGVADYLRLAEAQAAEKRGAETAAPGEAA